MNTKVAILGKLPSKFYAPFWDLSFDIWAFNYHKEQLPRVSLWFDIHKNNPNPIATITRTNYPFDEVVKMLGGNYFNNSVSYLIAYAILKNYKEIYLYGMQFKNDNEQRELQYQNVRELIFFAKGKGIEIKAPFNKVMLAEYPLYGFNN